MLATVITIVGYATVAAQNMWTQLIASNPTLLPADQAAKVANDLSLAVAASKQLSSNQPDATAAVTVKEVEGYLNDFLAVAAGPPINGMIPPPYNVIVSAVAFALPMMEEFVSSVMPGTTGASLSALRARNVFQSQNPMDDEAVSDTLREAAES